MHTRNTLAQSTRALRLLGVGLAVYFIAHLVGSGQSDIPRGHELVTLSPQGRVEVPDAARLEWYLTPEQRTNLTPEALGRYERLLESLLDSVEVQMERFEVSTGHSFAEAMRQLREDVAQGRFTDARVTWDEILAQTSPGTLRRFDPNNERPMKLALAELELFESEVVASMTRKDPIGAAGFLWTTRMGSTLEVLGIATLGALLALTLRRRWLERQGLTPSSAMGAYGLGIGAALAAWLLVRDSLQFAEIERTVVSLGLGFGLGTPLLGVALARLVGRDLTRELRRTRKSNRKTRIVTSMHDLNPESFAELKRAASQFATELVSVEAEEGTFS